MSRRNSNRKMDSSLRRAERFYLRAFLVLSVGVLLLVGTCWTGSHVYYRWQERRFMRQAHAAFEKGDLRWATIAAQRALAASSKSIDACRTLADIYDRQKNREAVRWRQKVLELAPDSLANVAALAETAIRSQLPRLAADVLDRVPKEKRDFAPYQTAAAHLALARRDESSAIEHLAAAARLAPDDSARQLELARWEIIAQDSARREHGRGLARSLVNDQQVALAAREILLDDAFRRGGADDGLTVARQILAAPATPFRLRLRALEALRKFRDPDFISVLAECQTEASGAPEKSAALIRWLNGQTMALVAFDWSRQLFPAILQKLSVQSALADSCVLLGDWVALDRLLKNDCWTAAKPLRFALQSKVAHETGNVPAADQNWTVAIEAAGSNTAQLELLHGLAARWKWPEKSAAPLWQLADQPRTQWTAVQALFQLYREERDTRGLYRALLRWTKLKPDDRAVQNNVAQLALLLGVDVAKARDAARLLHEQEPQNPAYASTYAFALYRAGDTGGALKVMQRLSPAQVDDPPIALYYGIILAGSNRRLEATRYLDLSTKVALLPEEETLRSQAANQIARR